MMLEIMGASRFHSPGDDTIHFKTDVPVSRSSGAGSIVVPFLFFSGLLLLVVIVYVVGLMPQRSLRQQQHSVSKQIAGVNLIIAKKMITTLLPSPPTLWSSLSRCEEVGHGVWFAEGVVGIDSPSGKVVPLKWKALFLPAPPLPLYLKAGALEKGDLTAALSQAGLR